MQKIPKKRHDLSLGFDINRSRYVRLHNKYTSYQLCSSGGKQKKHFNVCLLFFPLADDKFKIFSYTSNYRIREKYVFFNSKRNHSLNYYLFFFLSHNWTGNRVTLRDWFQLSLKEGLTVFRDQV